MKDIATLSTTKYILDKYNLNALKKYGQNFLIDINVVNKIIKETRIDKDVAVIEVGPGIGALTQMLSRYGGKVISFEIDERFYMLQHITRDKELIILDPLASFIGINENDNSSNKAFMDLISKKKKKDDKYIALIHHTPNDKLKGRGGEAIRDSSKVQYFLQKVKDEKGVLVDRAKGSLDVIVDKDNYNIFKDKPKKFRLKVFPNEN